MTTYHVPIPYLRSYVPPKGWNANYLNATPLRRGGEPSRAYVTPGGKVRIRKGGEYGSTRTRDWQAKAWNAALAGRWDSWLDSRDREGKARRHDRERERVPA